MISNHVPLQGCGYKYTSGGDQCLALSSCSFRKTFSLSCVTEKVLTQCYTIHLKIPKTQCAVTSPSCAVLWFLPLKYKDLITDEFKFLAIYTLCAAPLF